MAEEQGRVDGMSKEDAWNSWKDEAARYAETSQRWKDAQGVRDVRLDDLVKSHDNEEIDEKGRAKVAAATAKAVKKEKATLLARQESKKALDASWKIVQSFEEHEQPMPMIETEPEPEEPAPVEDGKKKRASSKRKKE